LGGYAWLYMTVYVRLYADLGICWCGDVVDGHCGWSLGRLSSWRACI